MRWLSTPPQGFAGVTACLKTPEVMEVGQEMPHGQYVHRTGIDSRHLKCEFKLDVVKDDTMGLVYMDTVTTSIGMRVGP